MPAQFSSEIIPHQYDYQIDISARVDAPDGSLLTYYRRYAPDRSVIVIPRAIYSVDPTTVGPPSAGAGTMVAFGLEVLLDGYGPVMLDGAATRLTVTDNSVSVSALLAEGEKEIGPGPNQLIFEAMPIPEQWVGKTLTATLHLSGLEGEILPVDAELVFPFPVIILPPPVLEIVELKIDAPNAPFVNTGQQFGLVGRISNNTTNDIEGPITVVDFKTGVPREEDDRQLAIYVSAARLLHPDGEVRGVVVRGGVQGNREAGSSV